MPALPGHKSRLLLRTSHGVHRPKMDLLSGPALREPGKMLRIDDTEFGVTTNRRTVFHGHDRQTIFRHLNRSQAHGFAQTRRRSGSERLAVEPVAHTIAV